MHFDRMSVIIYVQEGAVNVMKYFCCLLSSGAKQRATGDNEVYTATLHFFFFSWLQNPSIILQELHWRSFLDVLCFLIYYLIPFEPYKDTKMIVLGEPDT